MIHIEYETELHARGITRIAGIDEAGRGPLAGPVVAACVMLPLGDWIEGVDDSKKLSAKKREKLYDLICEKALGIGVGVVGPQRIDEINILQATRQAMRRAAELCGGDVQAYLVDAVANLGLGAPETAIIEGDALSYMIGAASIIAKVTRDRLMVELDGEYPGYGFAQHKGYGTKAHYAALQALGVSAAHRRSFLKKWKPGA